MPKHDSRRFGPFAENLARVPARVGFQKESLVEKAEKRARRR